ncbi:hypothetical protein E2C01_078507 [Portunus trituberculatus]|uniref:Uncharacterized protein n=1 Tax=Portunus trituberculatus TaxID=210409 RepID=A0A5B7IEH3_PORTR|nr:hypothetical protein [Portunus trituberculatus]
MTFLKRGKSILYCKVLKFTRISESNVTFNWCIRICDGNTHCYASKNFIVTHHSRFNAFSIDT